MATPSLAEFEQSFYHLKRQGTTNNPKTVTVLVIAWEPRNQSTPLTNGIALDQLIFGRTNSVAHYFQEVSQGRFNIVPFAPRPVVGPFKSVQPAEFYSRLPPFAPPTNPTDPNYYLDRTGEFSGGPTRANTLCYLDSDGFVDGYMHSWKEAIQLASAQGGVNFTLLDHDGDGEFSPDDGVVLIVKPWTAEGGYHREVWQSQIPKKTLTVNNVRIKQITEVYANPQPNYSDGIMAVIIEELLHALVRYIDQYPDGKVRLDNDPRRPGQYSISDAGWLPVHVDPFHKLKWGWLNPQLVTTSGSYQLREAAMTGDALILFGHKGTKEFFILENRFRGASFDRFRNPICGDGLALWDCIQDENLTIDWGRRALHLKRADPRLDINGLVQDDLALFDGTDPSRSYELYDDSYPQNLRFDDHQESSICIAKVSAAGPSMTVTIKMGKRRPEPNVSAAAWLSLLLAPEPTKGSTAAWLSLL
jgi:M6 family metalloprotease-like protein